jgi:HlyD family secretion protein
MKLIFKFLVFLGFCGLILGFNFKDTSQDFFIPTTFALRQNLVVEIKSVGELEAAHSTAIASSIKGDQGKIIDLITDGVYVKTGQILVKMDPTPFEDKIEKLSLQFKEQEGYISALEQAFEWEKIQAEHKNRTASYEIEAAKLELDKIMFGDGPQEISRLKGAMQKARLKYDELNAYSNDLIELEAQGFLNTIEVKQAQKKLVEEQEAHDLAKLQYESYVQHVYPMQIKKYETILKRAQVNAEETAKTGLYNVAKAFAALDQAQQSLTNTSLQLLEAEKELAQAEIKAPAPGMVVHREDYRSGQRRKPRVGDILVKNQPLLDLPDLSSMVVKTRVREVDLFKVGIGKKVTIEVDAYPQLSFQGTISSIGVLALADFGRSNEEKYFEVRIDLTESNPCLRPGMTTRVTIHAQEAQNVLAIPLHAVFDEHKHTYCYIDSANKVYEKREIKLGISNEQWVEVKEGLKEGECICLLNPNSIFTAKR